MQGFVGRWIKKVSKIEVKSPKINDLHQQTAEDDGVAETKSKPLERADGCAGLYNEGKVEGEEKKQTP
jgi:hypothetical protein